MTQYKALTFINLPFIERSFGPGNTIESSDLEEYVEAATKATPVYDDERGGHVPTVEELVEHFTQFGSLSDDLDAELHPDHRPVDPTKPTLAVLIAQAQGLVEQLEADGRDVPDELRTLAETEYKHVTAADAGQGADQHAG